MDWKYLADRPHPWRRQLYVKGRKVMASTVYFDMIADEQSPEKAADDWELPVEAIHEIIRYCMQEMALVKMEAQEEARRLIERQPAGVWRPEGNSDD